jgi:hypothetical protein
MTKTPIAGAARIPKVGGATKTLSAILGVTPKVSKPTNAIRLPAVDVSKPGSHAALLKRLYAKQ